MAFSSLPPEIRTIEHLALPEYGMTALANGMPMYTLIGGSEPVMKIEVVFRAGAWYEHKPGVAEFMAGLLSEGTQSLTSLELAEFFESRGATLQTRGGVDTVRVRLYTLTRFLPELIEVFTEVIRDPLFDEGELKVYAENKVERLKIDLKKNEVLAYRYLTEAIYGTGHPYGRNVKPDNYLEIGTEDLQQHHMYLQPDRGMVFVSGSFGAKEIDIIQHTLGQWQPAHANGLYIPRPTVESMPGIHEVDGPQTHQAAIRIGRKLFTQGHPDYPGMFVLNTMLGGFFGSRLMTEIRENQGLTYGIYSSVDSFAQDGCFYISTETATPNTEKVLEAIQKEIQKLQTVPVSGEELQMARNYMMGHLMTQLDGSFSSMDYIKSMKIESLENEQFADLVHGIRTMTPEGIMRLANQYLVWDECALILVK